MYCFVKKLYLNNVYKVVSLYNVYYTMAIQLVVFFVLRNNKGLVKLTSVQRTCVKNQMKKNIQTNRTHYTI